MYQVPRGEPVRLSQMSFLPSGLLSLVKEGRHNLKQPSSKKGLMLPRTNKVLKESWGFLFDFFFFLMEPLQGCFMKEGCFVCFCFLLKWVLLEKSQSSFLLGSLL